MTPQLVLVPPILIVCVIWQITGNWNEFLFGTVPTSGDNQPITSAIVTFSGPGTGERHYTVEAASAFFVALPLLFLYLFGGKCLVRGLTAGAGKSETDPTSSLVFENLRKSYGWSKFCAISISRRKRASSSPWWGRPVAEG